MYFKQLHTEKTENSDEKLSQVLVENDFDKNVCTSADCVEAAAEILNSIDPEIDPCEDFYGFACNGWIQNHPIPKVLNKFLHYKYIFCF